MERGVQTDKPPSLYTCACICKLKLILEFLFYVTIFFNKDVLLTLALVVAILICLLALKPMQSMLITGELATVRPTHGIPMVSSSGKLEVHATGKRRS